MWDKGVLYFLDRKEQGGTRFRLAAQNSDLFISGIFRLIFSVHG